jgi:hypothetical protein
LVLPDQGISALLSAQAQRESFCMSMMQHPSFQHSLKRTATARQDLPAAAEPAAVYMPARRHADRACCCAAKPAVIAIIPPGNDRHTFADLLLCGHHYRRLRAALQAKSATLLDVEGYRLATAWPEPVR